MPVTEEMLLHERGAQRQPMRLLRYIQHVPEIDAGAREVGCRTSHASQSLKSLVQKREKMLFRKSFHCSAARGTVGEDETGAISGSRLFEGQSVYASLWSVRQSQRPRRFRRDCSGARTRTSSSRLPGTKIGVPFAYLVVNTPVFCAVILQRLQEKVEFSMADILLSAELTAVVNDIRTRQGKGLQRILGPKQAVSLDKSGVN